MSDPKLIPVLINKGDNGIDPQCEMCGYLFRTGARAWQLEGSDLLACRGDSELCKIWLAYHASQLLVDADETIHAQGETLCETHIANTKQS